MSEKAFLGGVITAGVSGTCISFGLYGFGVFFALLSLGIFIGGTGHSIEQGIDILIRKTPKPPEPT